MSQINKNMYEIEDSPSTVTPISFPERALADVRLITGALGRLNCEELHDDLQIPVVQALQKMLVVQNKARKIYSAVLAAKAVGSKVADALEDLSDEE